jgi:hypothetical protein
MDEKVSPPVTFNAKSNFMVFQTSGTTSFIKEKKDEED